MRLARTIAIRLLPIHAPHPPDRYVCSPVYGTAIDPYDCEFIVDTYWPTGKKPIHYYFKQPAPSNSIVLPVATTSIGWESTCQVAIEPAGPVHRYPPYLSFSPDMMRALAGYLVQKCATESGGIGGFLTVGMQGAEQYLTDWVAGRDGDGGAMKNSSDDTLNSSGTFLTISITGKNSTRFAPGDTDPDIAGYLSKFAAGSSQLFPEKLVPWQALAHFLRDRLMTMTRGGPGGTARAWWDGTGLEEYAWLINRLFNGPSGTDNPEGSMPNSGSSDWTDVEGIGKNNDASGNQQQRPPDAGDQNGDGSDQNGAVAGEDGEMTYLCDNSNPASLAPVSKGVDTPAVGPDPIDCEKLSWSGLPGSSNPSSLLSLENSFSSLSSNTSIGKPLLFTHGTCTLAIFTTNPHQPPPPSTSSQASKPLPSPPASSVATNNVTTISWAHILAAFETLTNLCVANPLYPRRSRGGVAYWSKQGQEVGSWITGKKKRNPRRRNDERKEQGTKRNWEEQRDINEKWNKNDDTLAEHEAPLALGRRFGRRDRVDGVDGAMALPRGVNVTVFRTGGGTVPIWLEGALQCGIPNSNGGQMQGKQNMTSCGFP